MKLCEVSNVIERGRDIGEGEKERERERERERGREKERERERERERESERGRENGMFLTYVMNVLSDQIICLAHIFQCHGRRGRRGRRIGLRCCVDIN